MIQTKIKRLCKIILPNPEYGDMTLSVFPIEHTGEPVKLPQQFQAWEESLNEILKDVPVVEGATRHYVTIDSKFFTKAEFLRREGVHVDGNFCVDPEFRKSTWGGSTVTTWGGASIDKTNYKVIKDWVLPYDIEIPLGTYISESKGGIFCVSNEVGCRGWDGDFYGEVGNEGCFETMADQLTEDREVIFEKDTTYFMTSNTPHETLLIGQGVRRTFMRVTLNHEYPNEVLPCMQGELVYV